MNSFNVQEIFDHLPVMLLAKEWVRVDCPYCGVKTGRDDRRKCMSINTDSGWYACWRCKTKGRISVGERLPAPHSPETFSEDVIKLPENFELIYPKHGIPASVLEPYREYLRNRNIPPTVCTEAKVGAVPGNNLWAGRILVPVDKVDGTLAGWSARTIHPDVEPKYRYPKGFKRATSLFNKSELTRDTDQPVFVVEGVFDALALYPHAVAVLGKPTTAQENIIARTKRPICVALDGDAWQEGWAFAMRLRVRGRTAHSIKLPPCEDPATLGLAWLQKMYSMLHTDVTNGDVK